MATAAPSGQRNRPLRPERDSALLTGADECAAVLIHTGALEKPPAAAVEALLDADVQIVMLTGDNEATARRISDHLGIDAVIAEVLPCEGDGRALRRVGSTGGSPDR